MDDIRQISGMQKDKKTHRKSWKCEESELIQGLERLNLESPRKLLHNPDLVKVKGT